jgi:uncharacterized protein DUF2764
MPGQNYFLINALPTLGELGGTSPLKPTQLLEHISENAAATALVEFLFLGDDLLQRQGGLAGEITELDVSVLTEAQARDEQPLPNYLAGAQQTKDEAGDESATRRIIQEDDLWEAYYHHGAQLARRWSSQFLSAWIGFEVGLRNALAVARSQALGLESDDYLVAPELADDTQDFDPLLNEWTSAQTPLLGLRVLDNGRWNWLAQNDSWFTFKNDELAAYAVRIMLLNRWDRLSHVERGNSAAANKPEPE